MGTTFEGWTLSGIRNPNLLQSLILDKFTESTDGKYAIVDGNNVASFLIEGFASIASKSIQKIDESTLPAIYPSRAQSVGDLYKHLSDYSYLGLFAEPAQCAVMLVVDRDYLMKNAVDVKNEDGIVMYKKATIPQTTRFTIGQYTFGLYYPIDIRVSATTGMFTVLYDTTERNPLHVLSENALEYSFRKHETMNLAYIRIPVYQFNTKTTEEPLVSGSGYRRIIDFDDQFYAIRVTGEVRDPKTDTWSRQELELALNGRTYDPEAVTAVFTVDPDNHACIVEIPYVYFTENRIRGNIHIEIYTTSGYLNYQIPTDTEELVAIDMFGIPLDTEVQNRADVFRSMPALTALPISTKIIGGTNGMSYSELRRRIINNSFGTETLMTTTDIDAYFRNHGYVTSLFKDGITDRIYNAHATLRDSKDAIVAAASISTRITSADLEKNNTKSIIDCNNGTYTILPSMRYRFDPDSGICIPLSDTELDELNQKSPVDRVSAFNKNTYTMSPFHLQVSIKDKYPTTVTYDLTDADIESREYLTSRDVSQHLSLNTTTMEVVPVEASEGTARVTDRYRFKFRVLRSGLDNVQAVVSNTSGSTGGMENIKVIVGLKKIDGSYVFAQARYTDTTNEFDNFVLDVSASAVFTDTEIGHAVRILSPFNENNGVDVYLTTEMRVILCLNQQIDFLKDRYITNEHVNKFLLTDFTTINDQRISDFVALTEHRLSVRFGRLVNEIDQRISLAYKGAEYQTYETTELATLETPVYELEPNTKIPKFDPVSKSLIIKYPVGTLKGYASESKEAFTVSRFLGSNYVGLTWINKDGKTINFPDNAELSGWWNFDTPTGDLATLAKYEGTSVSVPHSRVTPRLAIKNAKILMSTGTTPILGTYELANAGDPNRGGGSTATDAWYSTTSKEQDTTRIVTTYRIAAVNALKYIIDTLFHKDSPEDPYPNTFKQDALKTLSASDGTIIVVTGIKNDGSVNAICNLVTAGDPDSPEEICTLSIKSNGSWRNLIAFSTLSELEKHVRLKSDGYTKATERVALEGKEYYTYDPEREVYNIQPYEKGHEFNGTVVYCKEPSVMGYAYIIDRVEKVSLEDGIRRQVTGYDDTESIDGNPVRYIAFMTTTEDGLPDFNEIKTVIKDAEGAPIGKTSDAWSAKVHKWPWEVNKWMLLNGNVATLDSTMKIEFDLTRMSKFTLHHSGQIVIDPNTFKPLVKDRSDVQYLINMVQIDAKLAETSAVKASHSYPGEIVSTMRSHFSNLGSIKNRLYTNTKLYFEPMKSLGYALFYTDGETTREYPLDIRMGFRLHVSSDISDDDEMMQSMRESIIRLIDDHMAAGTTNLSKLAELIQKNNSDSIRYVDVLGISDEVAANNMTSLNPNLQTMRCVDNEVRPHLKHELRLLDDGVTIDLTRGLDLEFVTADV